MRHVTFHGQLSCGRRLAARIRAFLSSGSEGGALIEMALSLPIVFLVLTGVFTFSVATNQKLEHAEAVNVGGARLAVDRGDTNPCSTVAGVIAAAAPGLKSSSISLTFTLGTASTSGTAASSTCAGTGGAANANLVSGGTAEIVATYPCSLIVYGKNFGTCSLSSQITEVVQ